MSSDNNMRNTPGHRRHWLIWAALLAVLASFMAYALTEADPRVYLIGAMTHGHHQIELACDTCHREPFGGATVLQDACVDCHGAELDVADDAHPKSKFTDPRNADRVALLDARQCVTCHIEHNPERERPMGVTLPDDFCVTCHADIAEDRPSHRDLEFATCADAGCHNFHDNRALYEDFLLAHQGEADHLDSASLPSTQLPRFMDSVLTGPRTPLTIDSADVPATRAVDGQIMLDWSATAHAAGGVNCSDCHGGVGSDKDWVDQPNHAICADCHEPQSKGFLAGKHGMRLAAGLAPMTPAMARQPMHEDAAQHELGCQSCHSAHGYDTQRARVEACLGCHDDTHSNSYAGSPHAALWTAEQAGTAPAGSGVTCASCHLPRATHASAAGEVVLTEHNQNLNLRPNEKMLREVCMNCHGLGFAIDALADPDLVVRNFNGRPAAHVPSIDWAARRVQTPAGAGSDSVSTTTTTTEGE